jgi:hypothetical protein
MDPIDVASGIAIVIVSAGGVSVLAMLARGWMKRWSQPEHRQIVEEATELRHAVNRLEAEVAELQERIDFTERVLASQQDIPRLEERH